MNSGHYHNQYVCQIWEQSIECDISYCIHTTCHLYGGRQTAGQASFDMKPLNHIYPPDPSDKGGGGHNDYPNNGRQGNNLRNITHPLVQPFFQTDVKRQLLDHREDLVSETAPLAVNGKQGRWNFHDDVIKWKHFPRNWPFVRGIHRSPVNSPHKGQWRGALMFSLICVWINDWVNNREADDLRRYHAHYDIIVMSIIHSLLIGLRWWPTKFFLKRCDSNYQWPVFLGS